MRSTTLQSYLYEEYADDDNLQGLVDAYNEATQTQVDWLNQVNLPYYPGLSGDLLNWVSNGLYGQQRTQLSSPITAAKGMLNTLVPLNTLMPLNTFTAATQTFYILSDDIFQRILTWNFYKGDGRHFSITWLKRRIARFLFGANGIDPQPMQSSFTVGVETASAIGVAISGGTVTVSLDQSLLSLQAGVAPGVLQLFQLAFQGGNLELPLGYTYTANIVVNFVALARPSALSGNSSAFSQTVGPTIVSVLGGTGIYTYAWTWQAGGTGITIDSPSALSTTFTASSMTWGQALTGIAACTVTDTVSSLTATATCEVSITCQTPANIVIEGGSVYISTEGATPLVVEP